MGRPRAPLRVLVVEDEALLAMDIGLMIEDAGHRVVAEAACLRDVERLDVGLTPDVALVDLQLSDGSSGFDVCAHIRRQWARAIIVFVTANPKRITDDHGAHGVISKPFSRNSLMAAIRYVAEGVLDPPPAVPLPHDFTTFPSLSATWTI